MIYCLLQGEEILSQRSQESEEEEEEERSLLPQEQSEEEVPPMSSEFLNMFKLLLFALITNENILFIVV